MGTALPTKKQVVKMAKAVNPGSPVERLPNILQSPAVALRRIGTDLAGRASGRADRLTPPSQLQNVGEGDFGAVGEAFVHYLQALAGLKPTDRLLDIGCGIGRTARVLARELRPPGFYDGFDVVPESIAWCQKHYRATRAPFRFTHADLRNTTYNPGGRYTAAEYTFPYPDGAFDLVFAISVFTHLVPESADRYLSEASRVLAPGGRVLLTWFLLRDVPAPAPDLDFHARCGAAAVIDPDNPEAAVAYPEDWVRDRINANNLRLRDSIQYGSWRGTTSICYQDIVVADRA